jgi:excisionase family DNA binding protein
VDTDLLTVEEAAGLLRVTKATIRKWIREGELPATRPGRRQYLVSRSTIYAKLANGATQPDCKQVA